MKFWKWLFFGFLALVFFLALGVGLLFLPPVQKFLVERAVADLEDVQVTFSEIRLRPQTVEVKDLLVVVKEEDSYHLESLLVRWQPWSFWRKRELILDELTLGRLTVDISSLARDDEEEDDDRDRSDFEGILNLLKLPFPVDLPAIRIPVALTLADKDQAYELDGSFVISPFRSGGSGSIEFTGTAILPGGDPASPTRRGEVAIRLDLTGDEQLGFSRLGLTALLEGLDGEMGSPVKIALEAGVEPAGQEEHYQLKVALEGVGQETSRGEALVWFDGDKNHWRGELGLVLQHEILDWWQGTEGSPGRSSELEGTFAYGVDSRLLGGSVSLEIGPGLLGRWMSDWQNLDRGGQLQAEGEVDFDQERWSLESLVFSWEGLDETEPLVAAELQQPLRSSFAGSVDQVAWWEDSAAKLRVHKFPLTALQPWLPEGLLQSGLVSAELALAQNQVVIRTLDIDDLEVLVAALDGKEDGVVEEKADARSPIVWQPENFAWPDFLVLEAASLTGRVGLDEEKAISLTAQLNDFGRERSNAGTFTLEGEDVTGESLLAGLILRGELVPKINADGHVNGLHWAVENRFREENPFPDLDLTSQIEWIPALEHWQIQVAIAEGGDSAREPFLDLSAEWIPASQRLTFRPVLQIEERALRDWLPESDQPLPANLRIRGEGNYLWLEDQGSLQVVMQIPGIDSLWTVRPAGGESSLQAAVDLGLDWEGVEFLLNRFESRLLFEGVERVTLQTVEPLSSERLLDGFKGLGRKPGPLLRLDFRELPWEMMAQWVPASEVRTTASYLNASLVLGITSDGGVKGELLSSRLRDLSIMTGETDSLLAPTDLELRGKVFWWEDRPLEAEDLVLSLARGEKVFGEIQWPSLKVDLADGKIGATALLGWLDLPLLGEQVSALAQLSLAEGRLNWDLSFAGSDLWPVQGQLQLAGLKLAHEPRELPNLNFPWSVKPVEGDRLGFSGVLEQVFSDGNERIQIAGEVSATEPREKFLLTMGSRSLQLPRWQNWADVWLAEESEEAPANGSSAPRSRPLEPFWQGFTGRIELAFEEIRVNPLMVISPWRQTLQVEDGALRQTMELVVNGGQLKGEQNLSFRKDGPKAYALTGNLQGENFNLAKFVEPSRGGLRPIEGVMEFQGRFQSAADQPDQLLDFLRGTMVVQGRDGLIRPIEGDDPIRRTLGGAIGLTGMAGGLLGQTAIGREIQAATAMVDYFRELKYDRFAVTIDRVENLDTIFRDLIFSSPEMRLTGGARIPHQPNIPYTDLPITGQINLFARGSLADLLRQVRLRGEAPDAAGFYPMNRPIPIRGSLRRIDTQPFLDLVIDGAMNRLRGTPATPSPPPKEEEAAPPRTIEDEVLRRLDRLFR